MITDIENALIAQVEAASGTGTGQLGYKLATIGSYGAELDEELQVAQPNFPAVWFSLVADARQVDKGDIWVMQPRWLAICATRSLRNAQARRHGGPAGEIGAYQLALDIRDLFAGQSLGLEIDPIAVPKIEVVHQGALRKQPVAVYAVELVTVYDYQVPENRDALTAEPLASIHTEWAGPPPAADDISPEQTP